jgi:hypothetical protein
VLTNVPLTEDVVVQTLLCLLEILLAMASCPMQESPTTWQCSLPLFLLHHHHRSSHHDSSHRLRRPPIRRPPIRRRHQPQGKAHKHKRTIVEASAASIYLFIAPLCFALKI